MHDYYPVRESVRQRAPAPSVVVVRETSPSIGYFPLFFGGRDVHHHHYHQSSRNADREDSRQTAAACIGGILMLTLAAVSGFMIKNFCKNREELTAARTFKQSLKMSQDTSLKKLVDEHIEVLENKSLRFRNIVLLSVGILACATAAFTGGMLGISWLITASIVVGVVSGSAGLFLLAYHWDDKTDLSDEMYTNLLALQQQYSAPADSPHYSAPADAPHPGYFEAPPPYNPAAVPVLS